MIELGRVVEEDEHAVAVQQEHRRREVRGELPGEDQRQAAQFAPIRSASASAELAVLARSAAVDWLGMVRVRPRTVSRCRDALELVFAAVRELISDPRDEVLDRGRHEYLRHVRACCSTRAARWTATPGGFMVRSDLDLTEVEPTRISSPSARTASRIAHAHSIARPCRQRWRRSHRPSRADFAARNRSSCRRMARS